MKGSSNAAADFLTDSEGTKRSGLVVWLERAWSTL